MAIVNAVEILHGYFSFLPFFPFALLQTLSKYVTASEVHVPSVAWGKQSPSRQGGLLTLRVRFAVAACGGLQ